MSEAKPIPFWIKYLEVGGKNGPSSEQTEFWAITRIYCNEKKIQNFNMLLFSQFLLSLYTPVAILCFAFSFFYFISFSCFGCLDYFFHLKYDKKFYVKNLS